MTNILEVKAVVFHVEAESGATLKLTFQLTDKAGVPVDITNDEVTFTVTKNRTGTDKISLSNGVGEHLNPANGETQFILTPAQTAIGILQKAVWSYAVRRHFATDQELVYFKGDIRLAPSMDDAS